MAYAEKREGKLTGKWLGQVYKNGRTFRRTFERKKDAEGYELYVKLTGEEPPTIAPSTGAPTMAEAVEMAKAMKGPRGVWDPRDRTLAQHLETITAVLGPVEVTQMGEAEFDRFKAKLDKQRAPGKAHLHIKDSTKNRYLTTLSAVLHCCEIKGWIKAKPTVRLYREANAQRAILRSEDQDAVILRLMREAGATVEAQCVEFLVATGLRRGELCGNARKAPLQSHQITIETDSEGNENGWVNLGGADGAQLKTNDSRRVLVDAGLAREMRALIAAGKVPDGDKLLKAFKAAVKAAGFPSSLVIHSLRHTRNTRLAGQNMPVEIRMGVLGHKTVKTNMIYLRASDADQLKVAKKAERTAGSSTSTGEVVPFSPVRKAL